MDMNVNVAVAIMMNRTLDASSAATVNALVFTGGEVWNEDEPDRQTNAILQALDESVPGASSAKTDETKGQSVSPYVRVFEGAYHSPNDFVYWTHVP